MLFSEWAVVTVQPNILSVVDASRISFTGNNAVLPLRVFIITSTNIQDLDM